MNTHAHDTLPTAAAIHGSNQALIQRHTGITDEQLFWAKIDSGLSYLYHRYGDNRPRIVELLNERFYWNWFMAQWQIRDAEFVAYHRLWELMEPSAARPARNVLDCYRYHHNQALNSDHFHTGFSYLIERRLKPQLFTV